MSKDRFRKRKDRRVDELATRAQRRLRDRHDRVQLVGAGGHVGNWEIVSGLWKEAGGKLVCVVSGSARGPWQQAVGEMLLFDPVSAGRGKLRFYREGSAE